MAYTCSSTLTRRSKVCTSKSRCTSIRRPPDNTTASPQLGSRSAGDFLMANSTGIRWLSAGVLLVFLFHRRFFRWRSSVLKLKPRLWQNSLRPIPLLTNSVTSRRTSARVRRLRAATRCSPFIYPLQHRLRSSNRCVARTLTFEPNEWQGFSDAAGTATSMVGVRIREEKNLKLYRKGQNPVLRGLANIRGERSAYLWTRGWTPRIQTYPGREVPNPLVIDINKGDADINVVLKDILALTKLNYNTCIFGDGMPITLKFADAVGEILTAGPIKDVPPLPFGHYI